jgi:hypothetical protein
VLGLIDCFHIPLFILDDNYSTEYNKIIDYWSFAIIRDPVERFSSAVSERFRSFKQREIFTQNTRVIQEEVKFIIDYLLKQPRHNHLLPAEFIHFQKQVDYLYLEGEKVIDTIYTIEHLRLLLDEVESYIGCDLHVDNDEKVLPVENVTVVHRNEIMRHLIESTRPITRMISKVLPEKIKRDIRSTVYIPRDQRLRSLFSNSYVTDFIKDYYSEDLKLWEKMEEQNSLNLFNLTN